MHTIEGLEEHEIVKVIDSIVNQLAPFYIFGYYTVDDIKQEGRIFGWEALSKFNPSKGLGSKNRNSAADKLYNFLYSHIKHRYFNLIRDNYERAELPNCKCKNCKAGNKEDCPRYQKFLNRNLIRRLIASPAPEQIEQPINHVFELDSKEFVDHINKNLPPEYRADFRRLLEGVKIAVFRKEKVKKLVMEIISEI